MLTGWIIDASSSSRLPEGASPSSTAADALLSYPAGALPLEVLCQLPSYVFSNEYLRTLACTCVCLHQSARDPRHWRLARICLDTQEFQDPNVLRAFMRAYDMARVVTVNAP